MSRVYLDHNACVPPVEAAVAALQEVAAAGWANPSSAHHEGQAARAYLERARHQVAALVGVDSSSVFFTSGGTEAAHAALHGVVRARRARRVVISALEHAAVRAAAEALAAEGCELIAVPSRSDGTIDAGQFITACREEDTAAALILAHNETGILQPAAEVARALASSGQLLVVDAVQAPGRLPVCLPPGRNVIGFLSAQKMGGLPGAGAVVAPADLPLVPFQGGGEQERRRRGGTPPVALIAAMGAAAQALQRSPGDWSRVADLRDFYEERLDSGARAVTILGRDKERLPNTCAFLAHGLHGEDVVAALDLEGVAVSSGSACATGSAQPSQSVMAMGYSPDQAGSMVRVSLGLGTTGDEMERAAACTMRALARMQPGAKASPVS